MSRVIDAVMQLTDKFTSPMNHTIKAMASASSEGKRMRKSIESAGKSINAVGTKITASVTAPILGLGVACGKMASDFEDGIAKVSTIADLSVMSLDAIRSSTIDLSNQLGVSVSEISEAQYNAISAGAATEKSLDLVSTAIKAAKAGFTDTATAVDGLTTVYNSFQGAVDYSTLSDQMLQTQNYGKTTFGELASSIGQVTPVANSLNVSTDELFSSIAILTKNGINTSSAITGLKAAYSNILKPTADASKTAKQLGIDFSATHLKAVGWAKFMEEIKTKVNGDADAMAKLFGSVEALNSMTVLAGAGLDDFNVCLDQMNTAAGLTQKSYEKMLTPSERWRMSLNKLKNIGIQVGEKLLPVFEKITNVIGTYADKFSSMSDEQVNSIIKIALAAASIGPAIMIFGKMVIGVSKLSGAFAAVKKAGGAAKLAIAALTSPVGIVIGTINGVINAVNGFLTGLNGIKIPDWVPKVGGKSFSIPLIPALARGTDSWGGGIAQVHERGGEIIDLPRGSRVYPHDESIRKARNEGKRVSFSIDKLADTIIVREEEDIDKIADRLYRKLVQAEANMGGVTFDGNMA